MGEHVFICSLEKLKIKYTKEAINALWGIFVLVKRHQLKRTVSTKQMKPMDSPTFQPLLLKLKSRLQRKQRSLSVPSLKRPKEKRNKKTLIIYSSSKISKNYVELPRQT